MGTVCRSTAQVGTKEQDLLSSPSSFLKWPRMSSLSKSSPVAVARNGCEILTLLQALQCNAGAASPLHLSLFVE